MKKIEFSSLKNYSSSGLVITALAISDEEERVRCIEEMNDVYSDIGLFTDDLKVVDLLFIDGNVLGEEGRHDWLMVLNGTVDKVNPYVRIKVASDVKWVDDFIDNYYHDYE